MHNNEIKSKLLYIIKKFERFLPLIFWLFFLYGFDEPYIAGLTVIAALIHECGHEGLLLWRTGSTSPIKSVLSGMRITKSHALSYRDEVLLYLFGPLANILAAAISLLLFPIFGDTVFPFSVINIASAVANLLPIEGYDGYGAIRALLLQRDARELAYRVLSAISLSLISLLAFLSLYLMDRLDGGYWIYAVFISLLISRFSRDNSAEKISPRG